MPDPKELTRLHENLNYHYPKSYLNAWAAGVRPDWATFLFKVFKEDVPALLDAENLIVMDLGCGPSICNIISASLCSHHIYMAELLEGNRKEIIKFLCNDTDAWNWTPYFEFQTTLEENEDTSSIEKRVRKSITGIIECNLATEEVFEEGSFNKKVDVLICSLVYDVVCTDVSSLETVMKRSLRFLNEDGLLLVQGSIDEHHYTIGSAILPVLDIKEVDFMAVVNKLDLEVLRWTTTVRCSTHYFTVLRRKYCKSDKLHLHKTDI